MKKSHLKKYYKKKSLKSKLTWIFIALSLFLGGSIYTAVKTGTGPLSFLTKTPTIARVDEGIGGSVRTVSKPASNSNPAPKVTVRWVEKDDVMVRYEYKTDIVDDGSTRKAVTAIKTDTYDNTPTGPANAGPVTTSYSSVVTKVNKDDEGKEVSRETTINGDDGSSHTYLTTPPVPTPLQPKTGSDCSDGEQIVFTSKGNHCIPTNGDSTICGVYAYSQNNVCYPIGYKEGDRELCDWTIDNSRSYAFFSNDCPKVNNNNLGMPKDATECSNSTTHPGWWSDAQNECIPVGSQIVKSDLIVCGAGKRTSRPDWKWPTLSPPDDCPSYVPPPEVAVLENDPSISSIVPEKQPLSSTLSDEELARKREECGISAKKYDPTSDACIKPATGCVSTSLKAGDKSHTICGGDGSIKIEYCNTPGGYNTNGICQDTIPTTPDTQTNTPVVTDPKTVVIPPPAISNKPITPEQVSNLSSRLKGFFLGKLFPTSTPITPTTGPSAADPTKPVPDTQTNTPVVTDPKTVVIPPPAVSNKEVAPETISNLSSSIKQLWEKLFPTSTPITPTTGPSAADPTKPVPDTQTASSTNIFSSLSQQYTDLVIKVQELLPTPVNSPKVDPRTGQTKPEAKLSVGDPCRLAGDPNLCSDCPDGKAYDQDGDPWNGQQLVCGKR